MKSCIYLRVSTADKQDVGMQEEAIKRYCEVNQIVPLKVFRDVGVSGSKESRPEFDQMLKALREREFDCVIVYKLDRIGRSTIHLMRLFEEFKLKNINFISVTQNFNTTTPEGKLMLRMMMILAEYERELIVGRVNDGLARARAKGRVLGRRFGSKDKKQRRKAGYYRRWEKSKS